MSHSCINIVVLASGWGSNLQAIIDATKSGYLNAKIAGVISDNEKAYALERARKDNITTLHINPKQYTNREAFDSEMLECLERLDPDLIVLAGFMRILSANLVNQYKYRIMNIHPSLLPKYKGLNTHERVLDEQEEFHGATVHFVTPELDSGPIIIQKSFPIRPSDSIASLKERVHEYEHEIYPLAIKWYAEGQLQIIEGEVIHLY